MRWSHLPRIVMSIRVLDDTYEAVSSRGASGGFSLRAWVFGSQSDEASPLQEQPATTIAPPISRRGTNGASRRPTQHNALRIDRNNRPMATMSGAEEVNEDVTCESYSRSTDSVLSARPALDLATWGGQWDPSPLIGGEGGNATTTTASKLLVPSAVKPTGASSFTFSNVLKRSPPPPPATPLLQAPSLVCTT